MNPLGSLILIGSLLMLPGCNGQSGTTTEAVVEPALQHVSTITESSTGAELIVQVDQTEIDLTGVISVHVTTRWKKGVAVELIEPDWEDAGWAGVSNIQSDIRFDGSAYSQTTDLKLEPFLSGDYQIPSVGIRAGSETAGKRIARLQPINITVVSVLDESEPSELDPPAGFAQLPSTQEDPRIPWGALGGLGIAIISGIVIVWLQRNRTHIEHNQIDPEAILIAATSTDQLSEDDLGTLYNALIELSHEHAGLEPMTSEIERIRYSGSKIDPSRVRSAAQRAVQVCGVET